MSYLTNPYMVTPVVTPLDDTSLKAYWKFSETSGTIYEVSESAVALGTPANITMSGGTYEETGTPSNLGTAVLFDGTDDYGYCGTSLTQFDFCHNRSALWTIAFWLKVESLSAQDYFMETSYTEGPSPVDPAVGVMFSRFEDTNAMLFHIARGEDNHRTFSYLTSNNYVPDFASWYLYIASFDYNGSAPQFTIRRDNANEETATKTGEIASEDPASYPLQFARRVPTPHYFGHFQLCEVSLWNKIMSDEDQTILYGDGNGKEIY